MAKEHKYAGNGIDIDTALGADDLKQICDLAAAESTGDLWKGSQRIHLVNSGDGWTVYEIKPPVRTWLKLLTFIVEVSEADGRAVLKTTIQQYYTTQSTVLGFIPVGAKTMVALHT